MSKKRGEEHSPPLSYCLPAICWVLAKKGGRPQNGRPYPASGFTHEANDPPSKRFRQATGSAAAKLFLQRLEEMASDNGGIDEEPVDQGMRKPNNCIYHIYMVIQIQVIWNSTQGPGRVFRTVA